MTSRHLPPGLGTQKALAAQTELEGSSIPRCANLEMSSRKAASRSPNARYGVTR